MADNNHIVNEAQELAGLLKTSGNPDCWANSSIYSIPRHVGAMPCFHRAISEESKGDAVV